MCEALLEVSDLAVHYGGRTLWRKTSPFEALCGIRFSVARGKAFGIVGESGAGKTTVARCVAGLQRPTAGSILFAGNSLEPWKDRDQRKAIQVVFQDPYSSLNPRMTIGSALIELLQVNGLAEDKARARRRAIDLLKMVGLPAGALEQRPRAFSGGQRQRIGIARALALEPTLLIADEPVSALDVSIQASILLLLKRLQEELGLTLLFISHDLAVVHQICDHVAVMSNGSIIEQGDVRSVFDQPHQPFTRELLAAVPELPPLELPPAPTSQVRYQHGGPHAQITEKEEA